MAINSENRPAWLPPLGVQPAKLGIKNQNPPGLSIWQLIREDYIAHDKDWSDQGFWALTCHRFGNWRMNWPRIIRPFGTFIYRIWRKIVQWSCGIKLDYTVRVGRRVRIWHFGGMILGAESIGNDVHIRQNTTFGVKSRGSSGKPIIQDRVDIGCGTVIVGRIVIGHDSVIGANAVVLDHVPPYSLVVGNPARIVRTLQEPAKT